MCNCCTVACPPLFVKKAVERIELVGQRRLAHRIAEVEQHARPAEDSFARPKRVKRKPGARRGLRAEKRVVLQTAAQRIEEAVLEVAMHRGEIVVVGALDVAVVRSCDGSAPRSSS